MIEQETNLNDEEFSLGDKHPEKQEFMNWFNTFKPMGNGRVEFRIKKFKRNIIELIGETVIYTERPWIESKKITDWNGNPVKDDWFYAGGGAVHAASMMWEAWRARAEISNEEKT